MTDKKNITQDIVGVNTKDTFIQKLFTDRDAEEVANHYSRGKKVNKKGNTYLTHCSNPSHPDNDPSMGVSVKNGKLLANCFSRCGGECLRYIFDDLGPNLDGKKYSKPARCEPVENLPTVVERKEVAPKNNGAVTIHPHFPAGYEVIGLNHHKFGPPSMYWRYYNYSGQFTFLVARFESDDGKIIRPAVWANKGGHDFIYWNGPPNPHMYNEYLLQQAGKKVLVVEGEKTCDAATQLFGDRYTCVTWPFGAMSLDKIDWGLLKGREVIIWPDADEPGKKASTALNRILRGIATSVRVVDTSEFGKGWDLADTTHLSVGELEERIILASPLPTQLTYDERIEELNKKYAYYSPNGENMVVRILSKEDIIFYGNSRGYVMMQRVDFQGECATLPTEMIQDGKKVLEKSITDLWWNDPKRGEIHKIDFLPNVSQEELDEWHRKSGKRIVNTFIGWAIQPNDQACWDLYYSHLKTNVCADDEVLLRWLLTFLADMLQDPCNLPGVALALLGDDGVGKSLIGRFMGDILGPYYYATDKTLGITGQFNDHLENKILIQLDEPSFMANKSSNETMKNFITEATIDIEGKGKMRRTVRNCAHFIFTSNNESIMTVSPTDRRYAIIKVENRLNLDYGKMVRQMKDEGGTAGLLSYLLTLPVDKEQLKHIPATEELKFQKEATMTDNIERWWVMCLKRGGIFEENNWTEDWVSFRSLYERYYEYTLKSSEKWQIKGEMHFTKYLFNMFGERLKKSNRLSSDKRTSISCRKFPDLKTCREIYDMKRGKFIKWDEV